MSGENTPFTFELTEEQQAIRQTIRDFAEDSIKPFVMRYDESQEHPAPIFNALGDMGFLGILVPEEDGGAGLGYVEYAIVVEEIARVDPSVALSVAAHNGLCTNHINLFANSRQKASYLKELAEGKKLGAWGLTEPASGSDAAGMETTAHREGSYFVLNGTKNFITNGGVGKTVVV
ncbi:MAG: acyl-CoA dehydrogenase, partial [Ignavibacteria bacterium]|nr:acyl-CoA dehydrogenase [Ignavibacteria bacterium]